MNFSKLFRSKKNNLEKGIEESIMLKALSKVPLHKRDDQWKTDYRKIVGQAKLACRIPQIQNETDGFPYFQLEIPDIGQPFQSYVIDDLIQKHTIKDGIGISVRSYHEVPDIKLTYGECLNYFNEGVFLSKKKNWIQASENQFSDNEEVMAGNPSDVILNKMARNQIRKYLEKHQILNPKISLFHKMTENGIQYQLCFNLSPDQFKNQQLFHMILNSLAWFLPSHYTYTAIPEHYLGNAYFDL